MSLRLLLCIGLALAGCRASPPDKRQTAPASGYALCDRGISRTSGGILRVCDRISLETVAVIRDALTESDKEIILTSGGGTNVAGIALGRLVRDRGLGLRVRAFCLSACSTYVLPAASEVVVEPRAVVAFHHTGSFALDLISHRSSTPNVSPIWKEAALERAYYSELGMDPELLSRLGMAIEPVCIGYRGPSGKRNAVVHFRYAWFIPKADEASRMFSGKLAGYWPSTAAEAQVRLRSTTGEPQALVRYGWPSEPQPDVATVARNLPDCVFRN